MFEAEAATRRGFLQSLGGGLLVVLVAAEDGRTQESNDRRASASREQIPQMVSAWLHMDPAGSVTAFTGKVEVGQNARTSLTQAVADEVRLPPAQIRLVMGDTALTPWDFGTVGSRTTPSMAPQLRKMAAAMREQLKTTAATEWRIESTSLRAEGGCIVDGTSARKRSYADLARRVDWQKVQGMEPAITPPAQWQSAGKSVAKVDAEQLVTGVHRYTSDLKRPGMLHGRVVRPSSFGAKLAMADTTAAQKMPGVTVVQDGDFIGVTAPDEFVAQRAVASIQAKWQEQPQISARDLFGYLRSHPEGQADSATAATNTQADAAKSLAASYTVAYIAHVPLEPRAAVAEWQGYQLTVWTGTQRPFGVRRELSDMFRISEDNVRVIVPDTGSAYGGKHTGECAIEAAHLAKTAGHPVKVLWSREEEFTWAYFRPAGVIDVHSTAHSDGRLISWDFHNYNSGPSGLESPYRSATSQQEYHETQYPLRQGSYRGLAATANHFARESHIDELATLTGLDPLAFRLRNLKEERVRTALEAATQRFEWSHKERAAGRGFGMACGMEKASYFATCVEVSVTPDRQIRVERVVEAFDCGAIVNPDHLRNQVEGAIAMGLGGALFEAIDFADGRILNPHLAQYRVPRFMDMPAIEAVLLDQRQFPSVGAGETPIMGIAPAISNALFQAVGIRVRSMPIQPALLAAQRRT